MPKKGENPLETLPSGQVIWARNAEGKPICNSPKRLNRGRCQQTVGLFLNGRCEDHGGKMGRGMEHPRFIHGKTSKYGDLFSGKALEQFERLLADDDYYLLREDIAVARHRLRELMGELNAIEPEPLRKLVRAAQGAEEVLDGEYDEHDLEAVIRDMVKLVEAVDSRVKTGKAVETAQEHVRRLVETENKRLLGEQEQIPANRALFLFMSLRDSVRTHVWSMVRFIREKYPHVLQDKDCPNPLKLINDDIERLLPTRNRGEVEPQPALAASQERG